MKVTAIMMTLNEGFYVKTILKNIIHRVDEIIITDGGSQDDTLEIIKSVSQEDFGKVRVIYKPQPVKGYYSQSWKESDRLNTMIEEAKYDWILGVGGDEAFEDSVDFRTVASTGQSSMYSFPRYNLCDWNTYIYGWYPDKQDRLFNRKADGGIRYDPSTPVHAHQRTDMGLGQAPARCTLDVHLVHYHDALGPKVRDIVSQLDKRPLPEKFKHPEAAVMYLKDKIPSGFDYSIFYKGQEVPPEEVK